MPRLMSTQNKALSPISERHSARDAFFVLYAAIISAGRNGTVCWERLSPQARINYILQNQTFIYMNYSEEFKKYAVKHHGISSLTTDQFVSSVRPMENMTRTVIEERPVNFREIDVFSRLMADRIIFLGTPVDDYIANIIQAQLLFLSHLTHAVTSTCISTARVARYMQVWAFMTPCSLSAPM